MSAADKIAEAHKVRRFKLVSEDGWHGMTVRPDGGYVSHKDYAALADLADAQAQEIARLRGLLNDERLLAVLGHAEDTAPPAIWAGMPSWFEDVSTALGDAPHEVEPEGADDGLGEIHRKNYFLYGLRDQQ